MVETYLDHGYKYVRRRGHPRAHPITGFIPEHFLKAEEKLGRPLKKGEIIVHKNKDKLDNRPSNLFVTTKSKAVSYTTKGIPKYDRAKRSCFECGSNKSYNTINGFQMWISVDGDRDKRKIERTWQCARCYFRKKMREYYHTKLKGTAKLRRKQKKDYAVRLAKKGKDKINEYHRLWVMKRRLTRALPKLT